VAAIRNRRTDLCADWQPWPLCPDGEVSTRTRSQGASLPKGVNIENAGDGCWSFVSTRTLGVHPGSGGKNPGGAGTVWSLWFMTRRRGKTIDRSRLAMMSLAFPERALEPLAEPRVVALAAKSKQALRVLTQLMESQ